MSDEKNPPSWWTTLPGVITAVSGLLTAVGGLLVVLNTLGVFDKSQAPVEQNPPIAGKTAEPRGVVDEAGTRTATYVIAGTNHSFSEKGGFLVSRKTEKPLCPTPPGWRSGCYSLEPQYRQNWRNTPDGYVANGKKVKTFTNRSERVFEILGTKHAFYVDDGHLYDYRTATILCPWPKAGVAQCQAIEARYADRWRNTPNGFIADGREFNGDEVMRQVRQGLF
jgi:hypothetical protein